MRLMTLERQLSTQSGKLYIIKRAKPLIRRRETPSPASSVRASTSLADNTSSSAPTFREMGDGKESNPSLATH